jgi:hypothetical protein
VELLNHCLKPISANILRISRRACICMYTTRLSSTTDISRSIIKFITLSLCIILFLGMKQNRL